MATEAPHLVSVEVAAYPYFRSDKPIAVARVDYE